MAVQLDGSLQAASSQAAGGAVSTPRLAASARQFESVLLGQWLQEAETTFAAVPGQEESSDPGAQQMQGFATQQLAAGLTASGGIGIAHLVETALQDAGQREQSGAHLAVGDAAGAMAAYAAESKP